MVKKLLLMLTLFMWAGTAFATNCNGLNLWSVWWDLNLDSDSNALGGSSISQKPNPQDVKAQYDVLKQVLSPIWWSVFYDTAKIINFVIYNNEIYNILWADKVVNKNFFTQIMWWADGRSFARIDWQLHIKAWAIILALLLIWIFGYSLWMTPVWGEMIWWWKGTWSNRWQQWMSWQQWMNWMGWQQWMGWMNWINWMNWMGWQQSQSSGWTITLWVLITKLQEMMKLTNQDPTIAKLAKQNLYALGWMLVLTISLATATFDSAITQLMNLKPLYYFISASFVLIVFFSVLYMYVKIVFSKLAKFTTNTEEVSPNSLFSDLLLKGIGGALMIWLIGGAIWVLTTLIVAN